MQNSLFFVFLHMDRISTLLILFLWIFQISAQDEVRLPADLRQHNLTTYNASLFNPTFAFDRNDPQSVAFWTRWQWQTVDTDPTSLFFNYTRKFNEKSVAGAAFFQHNTGIFFNTGGVLNYAYQWQFTQSTKLSLGFNLFGFVQKLADDRFINNPQLPIPLPGTTNDFILQLAPGASLSVERLTLSLASENLFDYNFRAKEANTPTSDKIFMGMMSYDFPLSLGANSAVLRPALYMRTIPEQENQIGILSMLRTAKYWGQLGYNNFYGVGVGAGGTFLKRLNLGAVFEFGTSASINSKDPSFEIVASYFLGNPDERDVTEVYQDEMDVETLAADELTEEEKVKQELEKAEELANDDERKENVDEEQGEEVVEEQAPATEELSKKEQRKAEREAAAEVKRLQKEQERLAREEQAQIERELKEAEAKRKEEAKQAELAEKQQEEQRKAEEKAAEEKRQADEIANAQRRQDSIAAAENIARELAQQEATKKRLDSLNEVRRAKAAAEQQARELQQRQDSIAQAEALAEEMKRKQDSIAEAKAAEAVAEKEEVQPEAGEKYEEVKTEDGLEPGFYLIANVFGTKKYYDAFMADLKGRGLAPKSFLRSLNNYNYVYLERYDTMAEARRARDSKFNGRYGDKTWVFRVVGE